MISHGAANFLKERLFRMSDEYKVPICNTCGTFAIYNAQQQSHQCKSCKDLADISVVELPFATR